MLPSGHGRNCRATAATNEGTDTQPFATACYSAGQSASTLTHKGIELVRHR
jgi:hypothetical protein